MRNREAMGYARHFRKHLSESERILWYHLRHQTIGARFRRQHPVGPYIVDFGCPELRLAIEADGYQHSSTQLHDEWRDAFLRRKRWVVLRFENNEIYDDVAGVLARIRLAIESLRG